MTKTNVKIETLLRHYQRKTADLFINYVNMSVVLVLGLGIRVLYRTNSIWLRLCRHQRQRRTTLEGQWGLEPPLATPFFLAQL